MTAKSQHKPMSSDEIMQSTAKKWGWGQPSSTEETMTDNSTFDLARELAAAASISIVVQQAMAKDRCLAFFAALHAIATSPTCHEERR